MDGDLITLKVLINRVLFKLALINIGCVYYSIVDKNVISELRLLYIKIPLKLIIGFLKENIKEPRVEIIEIKKFSIDILGYRRNIFAYMVPVSLNLIIIALL